MQPAFRARAALRFAVSATLLAACTACRAPRGDAPADIDTLASWLTGSFSSAAQAATGDGEYADVRMNAIVVWPERTDGRWIYVERARASKSAEPHWQRLLRLHLDGGEISSDLYLLPGDPQKLASARLVDMTPERASLRVGCTMRFSRRADGAFVGETTAGACPSELLHARSAMSTLTVTETLILSWDRGFDASGKQVWGPTGGPYLFARE